MSSVFADRPLSAASLHSHSQRKPRRIGMASVGGNPNGCDRESGEKTNQNKYHRKVEVMSRAVEIQ